MASTFIFNGRQISLPGVYSTIVSGEMNPARNLDYGKVLIIDTGKYSAGFGGGAGINGENAQGQNAIYTFDNIADFRAFMKGGLVESCRSSVCTGPFKPRRSRNFRT